MISDLDIYRAANLVIKRHGVDAELVAAQRVGQMIERGDFEGVRMWQRVTRAIVEMQGPGDEQAALEPGKFVRFEWRGWRARHKPLVYV